MFSARYITLTAFWILVFSQLSSDAWGQMGFSFDFQKPKEFENRSLRAEKTPTDKKIKGPRRFIQNTITHYNYFFNANNKLNDVLARAKASFRDDYSRLLPFYNYSLDMTAADSIQLDSVSYKVQSGIALHDLRNDWADNLYLLWGASYYLKKQFDSAYLMFQFINYAFAEKENDGYYKTIGSARDGNNALSISTKEKNSFTRRVFSRPPSRNDAFIWQVRNYLAQNRFSDASTLIQALKNDTLFPARLHNDLEEVQAFLFYKQQMWDSAAPHLEKALSNTTTKQEKARWEYLLGQLYENTRQFNASSEWYAKAISHTTDPVMDIYARLASIRVNRDENQKDYIASNIATLTKMAKRDKYSDYRDIIYYMAAQMELERNNTAGALEMLTRGTKYISRNSTLRNRLFMQMAELSFERGLYRQSTNFYDSLQMDDPTITDPEAITGKRNLSSRLADFTETIARQDSLQALAALSEDDRKDKVKKIVKQLRKQQGLKDEGGSSSGTSFANQPATSLFGDSEKKGDWYFYNSGTRQKGFNDFRSKWGMRKNTDNWRRSAAVSASINNNNALANTSIAGASGKDSAAAAAAEITFDALYERIPLTPEKLQQSNDSIRTAMFNIGNTFIQELEDCAHGTPVLEELRTRFPQSPRMDEILFNLYFCYNKQGETEKAAAIKKQMGQQFGQSNYTTIINTGKDPQSKSPKQEATKLYEKIYDLFIEGSFTEAVAKKKAADSIYGNNYWTPQLLYIEAVYYVKQREDSVAKKVLSNIIAQFASHPLSEKAKTLLDVLNRRKEIEEELRNMVINMPAEDTAQKKQPVAAAPVTKAGEPPSMVRPDIKLPSSKDSLGIKAPSQGAPGMTQKNIKISQDSLAVQDTVAAKDSTLIVQQPVPPGSPFSFNTETPHYVVIILNKVDPVFVNEARNAFYRYNRDTYFNKNMQAELVEIDNDNRLLLISPFKNAAEAIAYIDQTKPKTSSEIVPWLKGGKYTYSIITDKNLDVLKGSKDINAYMQFLEKMVPGKF
ncbi:MAG: tetratricopeptide repeat protein [Chitinophagaceae bacterium]